MLQSAGPAEQVPDAEPRPPAPAALVGALLRAAARARQRHAAPEGGPDRPRRDLQLDSVAEILAEPGLYPAESVYLQLSAAMEELLGKRADQSFILGDFGQRVATLKSLVSANSLDNFLNRASGRAGCSTSCPCSTSAHWAGSGPRSTAWCRTWPRPTWTPSPTPT